MDYVQKTIQAFDADPDKYSAATGSMVNKQEMAVMLKLMPPNEKSILDEGCGPGRDAKVFSDKGYQVTGIDLSEELIKKARQTNPELQFKLMDVRKLGFSDNTFGAVWCSAVLLHLNGHDLEIALKEIFRVLKPKGVAALSFKEGSGEKEVKDTFSTNLSRFYHFETQGSLNALVEKCGFRVAESYILNERETFGPDKRDLNWVWTFAVKP